MSIDAISPINSESIENQSSKHNFLIIGFGDLGKWWHQILTEANQNVYVASLNNTKYTDEYTKDHHVETHNLYQLPIDYKDIDVVLVCCTSTDLSLLAEVIPPELKKKVNNFVFFQNGIWIRERLRTLFDDEHPTQSVPYFSFKTQGGKTVEIKSIKPSPITWDLPTINVLMSVLNEGPKQDILFEWVDSILLRKEERRKGYINAFLNTICVIYRGNVEESLKNFYREYGAKAFEDICKEFYTFNNEVAKDALAYMSQEEINSFIQQAIKKFGKEFPSTYIQYYVKSKEIGEIRSDEQRFIWTIMRGAEQKWVKLPILDSLYEKMMHIKSSLNHT